MKSREQKTQHLERVQPSIRDAMASYDLLNLKPGDGAHAMAFKPDPAFPDARDPNRIQVITVAFFFKVDPKGATPRNAWAKRTKETFDYAALARLLD